nr:MAG TPA: hypothetical protein [Caudoviricetes sp.]
MVATYIQKTGSYRDVDTIDHILYHPLPLT